LTTERPQARKEKESLKEKKSPINERNRQKGKKKLALKEGKKTDELIITPYLVLGSRRGGFKGKIARRQRKEEEKPYSIRRGKGLSTSQSVVYVEIRKRGRRKGMEKDESFRIKRGREGKPLSFVMSKKKYFSSKLTKISLHSGKVLKRKDHMVGGESRIQRGKDNR